MDGVTVVSLAWNCLTVLPDGMYECWLHFVRDLGCRVVVADGFADSRGKIGVVGDGRSSDATRELAKHVLGDKLAWITPPGRPWKGKTEMCNACLSLVDPATRYLWQIDSDEFYTASGVEGISRLLATNLPDQLSFYANHFMPTCHTCIDELGPRAWGNNIPWERVFKWQPGSVWVTHEPPRLRHPDLRLVINKTVVGRDETLKHGIKLFHYGYVSRVQLDFKCRYYACIDPPVTYDWWSKAHHDKYGDSIVHEFVGEHPKWIQSWVNLQPKST